MFSKSVSIFLFCKFICISSFYFLYMNLVNTKLSGFALLVRISLGGEIVDNLSPTSFFSYLCFLKKNFFKGYKCFLEIEKTVTL